MTRIPAESLSLINQAANMLLEAAALVERSTEEELSGFSEWVDVTASSTPYQHLVNRDGRERWRPRAKPEDTVAPEWRRGKPPA
jgi:hypothetical protein